MMMANDDWVRVAMTDDTVVVELLIRLKQSQAASLSAKFHSLPFTWGLKQPRSKLASASRCGGALSRKKDSDSTRCSPTTPLSWSGSDSPSATADGYEDCSRPTNAARSKATATSEYIGNSASTKRCRKKKTFYELKEEENSLLKERFYLETEIANLNATFTEERVKNESLKRMKLDVNARSENNSIAKSDDELMQTPSVLRRGAYEDHKHETGDDSHPIADSKAIKAESTGDTFFMIPDLNAMPSEDVSYSECGMS